MKSFQELIRSELQRKNISQKVMADAVGVTPAQISRILSGERGASDELLQKIANFLTIPIETIYRALKRIPQKSLKNTIIERIDLIFAQLPEEDQEELYDMIERRYERRQRKK